MSADEDRDELSRLIEAHLDGSLDAAGTERLERLLVRDEAATESLVEAAVQDRLLFELGKEGALPHAGRATDSRSAPVLFWAPVLAAAASVLIFFIALQNGEQRGDRKPKQPSEATEGRADDFGGASIAFSTGAVWSRFTPRAGDDRLGIRLDSGAAAIDVPEGARRVEILTPNGSLRDVGTRFEVEVRPNIGAGIAMSSKTTAIVFAAVLAGAVDFIPKNDQDANRAFSIIPAMGRLALEEDGAVAKVEETAGLVYTRAKNEARWRSVTGGSVLEPGALVKTALRGANACSLRLVNGVVLVLGPGAQIEIVDPQAARLVAGDLVVDIPKGVTFSVTTGGAARALSEGKHSLRFGAKNAELLADEPSWHKAFASDRSTERMGSLLALVDGRNVPLTMGYHKVSVDIRDQLARTSIEESFVNQTTSILEGTFYFPLPADASISSFAMWIGDEKVEGEIVEKERAREIYETILREKRDPGLLEWTGGNIFKARVYPIAGEKRIEIRYTQVLPKHGDTIAYDYPLRSDMLRTTPLRKLEILVTVSSAAPIESVVAKSHPCRIDAAMNSAKIEFSAEEYAPTRDFELRIDLAKKKTPLVVLPHRRGDDGYFLALFDAPPTAPPGAAAKPLDLIVLADTSGSINGAARSASLAFLTGLLESLGENDRFRLATFDVEPRWLIAEPSAATSALVERAAALVEARRPLGWTDLEAAVLAALERSSPDSQIVVVGDGVLSKGDRDQAAFLARMRQFQAGRGAIHTVSVGSSFDALVMRGLGLLGGSSREVRGAEDAAVAARGLIDELTRPGIRDLEFTISGIDAAAVYPERLPNLAAGSQAFVVGRYDPRVATTGGKITISGVVGGRRTSYEAEFPNVPADGGNSFMPRLWAKSRLDHLLLQGGGADLKERIISLSEEFQIVTPYTSFLVLESDADRERFRVKRQFRMRDGEDFFAKGRADAAFQLKQKELVNARRRRTEFRRALADRFGDLGDSIAAELFADAAGPSEQQYPMNKPGSAGEPYYLRDFDVEIAQAAVIADPIVDTAVWGGEMPEAMPLDPVADPEAKPEWDQVGESIDLAPRDAAFDGLGVPEGEDAYDDRSRLPMLQSFEKNRFDLDSRSSRYALEGYTGSFARGGGGEGLSKYTGRRMQYARPTPRVLSALPMLPGAAPGLDGSSDWPPEIVEVVRSLDLRRRGLSAGRYLRVKTATTYGVDEGGMTAVTLAAQGSWSIERRPRGFIPPTLDWLDAAGRGTLDLAWLTAAARKATPFDAYGWCGALGIATCEGIELNSYPGGVTMERPESGLAVITIKDEDGVVQWIGRIDIAKRVLLSQETYANGKLNWRYVQEDFREVGGLWLPRTIRAYGEDLETVRSESTIEAEEITGAEYAAETARRIEILSRSFAVGPEMPSRRTARRALAEGSAGLAERWTLLIDELERRRLDLAKEHAEALLAALSGKTVRPLVEALLSLDFAHAEDSRREALSLARALAEGGGDDERRRLVKFGELSAFLPPVEQLEILDVLASLYDIAKHRPQVFNQRSVYLQALRGLGESRRTSDYARVTAELFPEKAQAHIGYAYELRSRGLIDEAVAALRLAISTHAEKLGVERHELRVAIANLLIEQYRFADYIKEIDELVREAPEKATSYVLARYLSALTAIGRYDDFERTSAAWRAVDLDKDLDTLAVSRLDAAVQAALGSAWLVPVVRIEAQMAEKLADFARAAESRPNRRSLASSIVGHSNFRATIAGRKYLTEIRDAFIAEAGSAPYRVLARRISLLGGWTGGDPRWQRKVLIGQVLDRWTPYKNVADDRHVDSLVAALGDSADRIRSRRMLVAAAGDEVERRRQMAPLYAELQSIPWTLEGEDEVFALLPIAAGVAVGDRSESLVLEIEKRLRTLVPSLVERRVRATLDALAGANALTGKALAKERARAIKAAREAVEQRLSTLAESFPVEAARRAFRLEALLSATRAGRNGPAHRQAFVDLLTPLVAGFRDLESDDIAVSDATAAFRGFTALAHLTNGATDAEPMKELDAALSALPPSTDPLIDPLVLGLQVAVVRGDRERAAAAIERGLREKKGAERAAIGRLKARMEAESGAFPEAIATLEAAIKDDASRGEDQAALRAWRTVLGQVAEARAARIAEFAHMDGRHLGSWLQSRLARLVSNGDGAPGTLDDDVPDAFTALLRRSDNPSWHLSLLRDFYARTKDPRLLRALADAMVGSTAQQVYPLLQQAGPLLEMMRDEAVIDETCAAVEKKREATASVIDRRALDLLVFLTRHRALEQANGATPHLNPVLRALEASYKAEFATGEGMLYAYVLANRGTFAHPSVVAEVLRQVTDLQAKAERGTEIRFQIAAARAGIEWQNGRPDDSVRTLASALEDVREKNGGLLPGYTQSWWSTHPERLQLRGQWRDAEAFYLAETGRSYAVRERAVLERGFAEASVRALAAKASLSAGSGIDLYRFAYRRIADYVATHTDDAHRGLFEQTASLWRTAAIGGLGGAVSADIKTFASIDAPRLLARNAGRDPLGVIGMAASALRDYVSPLASVEFLVTRTENEAPYLITIGEDVWGRHSWSLGESLRLLGYAAVPGDLKTRLARIVDAEFERDILSTRARNRAIYTRSDCYWTDRAGEFVEAACRLASLPGSDEGVVLHAAQYLVGLSSYDTAADLILRNRTRTGLGTPGRRTLASIFEQADRWPEAAGEYRALVELEPDSIDLPLLLMRALSRFRPEADVDAVAASFEARFLKERNGKEGIIANFADACLHAKLLERAAPLYEEAAGMRVRSLRSRGIGDHRTAELYHSMSETYARLGMTQKAVDAASAEVIVWPAGNDARAMALGQLQSVLRRARDFDAYVLAFEAETAKSGLENPILRRAVGGFGVAALPSENAAEHFRKAFEAAPGDLEIGRLWVDALTAAAKTKEARSAAWALAEAVGRDPELFVDLGRRSIAAEDPETAERAFTNAVEISPNEAENHKALAEVRESVGRLPEAAIEWGEVAKLRSLEPTGLLNRARIYLALGKSDAARVDLERLRKTKWPERFAADLRAIEDLEERLRH